MTFVGLQHFGHYEYTHFYSVQKIRMTRVNERSQLPATHTRLSTNGMSYPQHIGENRSASLDTIA